MAEAGASATRRHTAEFHAPGAGTPSGRQARARWAALPPLELATAELQFLALGDWGSLSASTTAVAAGMAAWVKQRGRRPDFVLGLGDNFYPAGCASVDDDCFQTLWADTFLAHRELRVPWRMILGNHDYEGEPRAQVEYTSHARNTNGLWQLPDTNYTFECVLRDSERTRVSFFGLDTNGCQGHVRRAHPEAEQDLHTHVAALGAQLGAASVEDSWKIVFGHHPLHTAGHKHSVLAACLRDEEYDCRGAPVKGYGLGRVLEAGGVAAYFAGHEHVMQAHRHQPSSGGNSGAGVATFVSGAVAHQGFYGGRADDSVVVDWHDATQAAGFTSVTIAARTCTVEFVDAATVEVIKTVVIDRPWP